jgi:hypothetical protein
VHAGVASISPLENAFAFCSESSLVCCSFCVMKQDMHHDEYFIAASHCPWKSVEEHLAAGNI